MPFPIQEWKLTRSGSDVGGVGFLPKTQTPATTKITTTKPNTSLFFIIWKLVNLMIIKDKSILAHLTYFIHSPPRQKRIPKPRADSSPDPSSAREIQSRFCQIQIPRKIVWQNRVRIWIPPVSPLGETRPRSRHHHTEKKKKEIAPKQNRMRGGEARADTEQQKRRDTASAVSRSGGWTVAEFITSLYFGNRF